MSARQTCLVLLLFLTATFAIYAPCLHGGLISDDWFLLRTPEIQQFSAANLRDILDPAGSVAKTYVNYSPVHAVLHALERRAFGDRIPAYHAVNLLVHVSVSLLLIALFVDTGIPRGAALAGGALFLLHPANVEAVAWISQLKTTGAAALATAALVWRRRRLLASVLFGLALLTKAQAAFALPVLALLEGSERAERGDRRRWLWVGVWALLFAGYALLEGRVYADVGAHSNPALEADPFLHLRAIVAIAARYLAMAATSHGLSTLHEPPLPISLADPWWCAGLAAGALLGWRFVHALRRRSAEAAYWIWAAAGFAPVSQVFPFVNPMGDRYLYFMLPGLLGAALLAGCEAARALPARWRDSESLRTGAAAAALAVLALFALRSLERARVFRDDDSYLIDSALHYPDGISAHVLRARGYARRGEVDQAMDELRAARSRGWAWVGILFTDRDFRPLARDPRFRDFVRELGVKIAGETGDGGASVREPQR
jgi:hypothetical protein